LVRVGPADPLGGVSGNEIWIYPGGEFGPFSCPSGIVADSGENFALDIAGGKRFEDFVDER
jgi:hypothetical protein